MIYKKSLVSISEQGHQFKNSSISPWYLNYKFNSDIVLSDQMTQDPLESRVSSIESVFGKYKIQIVRSIAVFTQVGAVCNI